MKSRPIDSALRVPNCPYPGLRPFLDHEASLLQGRSAQIDEVVRRLAETRFVAVVGGSGSGKSSLIRAGVVPRLRALAISEAGQYWVPIVFTPGTTVAQLDGASDGNIAKGTESTPLTRLAWKFDKALREVDGETPSDKRHAAERRRANIAALMRLSSGFNRLVEFYTEDLPEEGADRSEARFLFVIDQFEELFDFSNRKLPDAKSLVDALIGHFARPDPRVYVVITMRSERLADCAAYLELPEAINRSMYLLRRLNDVELRDAIVGPAKSYLRLCQRARSPGLPPDVVVDHEVIAALLTDVAAIADDPDHLPLLQHLLARTWQIACEREGCLPEGVPRALTMADLDHAASPPGLEPPEPGLVRREPGDPEFNRLRESLDRWAQLEYEQPSRGCMRSEADRKAIDAVLRRLGYRDPNNGLYFQDRLAVADERLSGDVTLSTFRRVRRLHRLLKRGFLDKVNYLHWDKEDRRHQTLKVSHEAFIRGWQHFRHLIDKDAERFEEFLLLLRRCAAWEDQGRPDDPHFLLEPAELARIDSRHLPGVLQDRRERADWFRVVEISRDGRRLAKCEEAVGEFIRQSRALRNKQQRRSKLGRSALIAVGSIAVVALTVTAVLWPVIGGIEDFASARHKIERMSTNPDSDATLRQLGTLVGAGRDAARAHDGVAMWYPWSRHWMVSWMPLIGTAGRLPDMATSEPLVNGRLYHLLTSGIWRSGTPVHRAETGHLPKMVAIENCSSRDGTKAPGTLFVETNDDGTIGRRALFLPSGSIAGEREPGLALYPAVFNESQGTVSGCQMDLDKALLGIPLRYLPRILLDARLQYVAAALTDSVTSVTLYELNWRRLAPESASQPSSGRNWTENWVSTDALAIKTFDKEFGNRSGDAKAEVKSLMVRAVPTWREPGGYGFLAGGSSWRILKRGFERIPDPESSSSNWLPLATNVAPEHCRPWKEIRKKEVEDTKNAADSKTMPPREAAQQGTQPVFDSVFFSFDDRCLEVKRGSDAITGTSGERIMVTLYDQLNLSIVARIGKPPAVASLVAYEDRPKANEPKEGERWVFGKPGGTYDGWIGLQWREGDKTVVEAAPLTTNALLKLASSFCKLGVQAANDAKHPVPPEAKHCQQPQNTQ
jgi:hypothetical protein